MKSSFNAFGKTRKVFSPGNMPIWLGTVGPVPVGGTLAAEFVQKGVLIPAGCPVNLTNKVITPLVSFAVVGYEAGETNDKVTVRPYIAGIELEKGDNIMKVGATFSAKGTGYAIVSIARDGENFELEIAHEAEPAFAVGDAIVEAAGAGANKYMKSAVPTHYLYNDINLGDIEEDAAATGACVSFHADGILIDRTPAAEMASACAAAIPHVLQVKG